MEKKVTTIVTLSAVVTIGIVIAPIIVDHYTKSDSQWIAFFASYLGGILGGIVSGGLTLGGVYLSIRHQNKALNRDKFEKLSYVLRKLFKHFWRLDVSIEKEGELSAAKQVEDIKKKANEFLRTIEDNMHIIRTDYKLLHYIESLTRSLKDITDYNFEKTNHEILEDFSKRNQQIQTKLKQLEKYEKSLYL